MRMSDWISDVCSSDRNLGLIAQRQPARFGHGTRAISTDLHANAIGLDRLVIRARRGGRRSREVALCQSRIALLPLTHGGRDIASPGECLATGIGGPDLVRSLGCFDRATIGNNRIGCTAIGIPPQRAEIGRATV